MQLKQPIAPVTPRQLQVLRQIALFEKRQCYSATIGELAGELGVSRPTVFEHVEALRAKKLLESTPGKARSLKLTRWAKQLLDDDRQRASQYAEPGHLPLLGRVAAGVPIEAVENAEVISLQTLFGNADDVFVLEVAGDSMIDDGVQSGDYVVCQRSKMAHNGQMVVAIVDDDNATLKKFYKEDARVRLQPANDDYAPIYSNNCRIEAVVLGLLRKL